MSNKHPRSDTLLFVIKLSKYCNLRCSYCYEFSELSNKTRITLDNLVKIFTNISSYTLDNSIKHIYFVWHGGEPFLIPEAYYKAIGALQKKIFHKSISIHNGTQTNGTVCKDSHINFMTSREFFNDGMGISFDVYGKSRVDIKGEDVSSIVINNIQRFIDAKIPVGAIVVLERSTIDKLNNILDFYDAINIPVRFLPFYKADNIPQIQKHGISASELTTALISLFDHWLKSQNAVSVSPIDSYISFALNYLNKSKIKYYDRNKDENIYIINTDGHLWSDGDAYDYAWTYGDLISKPLDELLSSENKRLSIQKSKKLSEKYCRNCNLYGYCPGEYVSNATRERIKMLESDGCPIAPVIRHISEVLPNITNLDLKIKKSHKNSFLDVS